MRSRSLLLSFSTALCLIPPTPDVLAAASAAFAFSNIAAKPFLGLAEPSAVPGGVSVPAPVGLGGSFDSGLGAFEADAVAIVGRCGAGAGRPAALGLALSWNRLPGAAGRLGSPFCSVLMIFG